MLQPTKGLAVDDPIPIPLKNRAQRAFGFRTVPPPAQSASGGPGGKNQPFPFFNVLADGHSLGYSEFKDTNF
jgi:hypothetical protein